MTEDKIRYLASNPLPKGVYTDAESAIICYAQKSTRMEPIDNTTYKALKRHFNEQQIIDICLTVGYSNIINRFHATFLTDVDEQTLSAVEHGNPKAGDYPIPLPKAPK